MRPTSICGRRTLRRRAETGASAVEFALVMPLLLALLFAIISFGFLFAQDLALGNAARQTARFGVVENRTCADVIAEAKDAAKPLVGLSDAQITIARGTSSAAAAPICGTPSDLPCKSSADKDNIYVTLTYQADVLVPIFPGMGSKQTIDGEGVFRCEWF